MIKIIGWQHGDWLTCVHTNVQKYFSFFPAISIFSAILMDLPFEFVFMKSIVWVRIVRIGGGQL